MPTAPAKIGMPNCDRILNNLRRRLGEKPVPRTQDEFWETGKDGSFAHHRVELFEGGAAVDL